MSFVSDIAGELNKLPHDRRTLMKFGVTMSVVLGLIGVLIFFKGQHPERAYWVWNACALFLLLGFAAPAVLRPVHKLWMGLAFVLGWFMSRLILSLVYYLVLTPIGLAMRVRGKDFLNKKIDKEASTYWIKRPKPEMGKERYERLF